jgi:DNA-binding XRE family transcriptional regulator
MTNSQFAEWRPRFFRSRSACAARLGIDRETVAQLETGTTRKGNPFPVPPHIALACAAWTMGLREYDGGAVKIGG